MVDMGTKKRESLRTVSMMLDTEFAIGALTMKILARFWAISDQQTAQLCASHLSQHHVDPRSHVFVVFIHLLATSSLSAKDMDSTFSICKMIYPHPALTALLPPRPISILAPHFSPSLQRRKFALL